MVYIIGVDHLVQYNGPVPEKLREEFRGYLVTISRTYRIDLIAEEFSSEALTDVYHAAKDTAQEAAELLGIPHRFCDMEEVDMRRMGIPYFAEIMDSAKHELGIDSAFILDDALRTSVREKASAVSKTYWDLRESFWYDKIARDMDLNLLFICGHEHTGRFRSLVRSHGTACHILDNFWRERIFRDYKNFNLD
jgi:hypothetical protein